jgi:hypothetical protein
MPVITTDVFQKRASRYLFGAVACFSVLAVIEYCLFSYAVAVGGLDGIPGGIAVSFFVVPFFLFFAFASFRRYRYFNTVPPLAVHTLVFSPSITGQPPMKITFAFQWPNVYDADPNKPSHTITPLPHLQEQLQADIATCLNEYFGSFSKTLETTHPKYLAQAVYPHFTIHFLNTLVLKPVETFAQTTMIPYLKYDCTAVDFPKPKTELPPPPKDRIYL